MYAQQPTGIAPERVKQMKMDLTMTDTKEYILRPEAMESFWYATSQTTRARAFGQLKSPCANLQVHAPDHGRPQVPRVGLDDLPILREAPQDDVWLRIAEGCAETTGRHDGECRPSLASMLSLFKHQNALLKSVGLWSQDRMESFWLAETLKYTYMLQDDEASVDLEKFVLNTEAHPFPIADKPPVLADLT